MFRGSFFIQKIQFHSAMHCIAETASCSQVSPGAVQLRKPVAADGIRSVPGWAQIRVQLFAELEFSVRKDGTPFGR